jgi:hypothetical protein
MSAPLQSFYIVKTKGLNVFALISVAAGTLAAVLSVPQSVDEADSLVVPAACMTSGLLMPIVFTAITNMSEFVRVENILMLGIVYWILLDPLQSAYPYLLVESEEVQTAFIAIGLFSAAIWVGASGAGWPLPRIIREQMRRSLSSRMLLSAVVIAFLLGMFDFALNSGFDPGIMVQAVLSDRWAAPWDRGTLGGADAFADHLQYFGYLLPSLSALLARSKGWFCAEVFLSVLLTTITLIFLAQEGGRRVIGTAVGAGLLTGFLLNRGKLTFRNAVLIVVGVAVLLGIMQEMLRYRNLGFDAWLSREDPELEGTYLHVDDNFLRLAQTIWLFPDIQGYVSYRPLYHALMLPVPRLFWPGKPIGPGFDLAELLGMQGVSLSSSMIGELYASYGLFAVALGGLVIGRISGMWNKCLEPGAGNGNVLIFALGVMALFSGLRSLQALVQMSYMILAWIAVSFLVRAPNGKLVSNAR